MTVSVGYPGTRHSLTPCHWGKLFKLILKNPAHLRWRFLCQVLQVSLHGRVQGEEVRVGGRLDGIAGNLQRVAGLADEGGDL